MAKEKKTERKYQWCNTCRKLILGETFISHQILCARKRKPCNECSASRVSYLVRHKRNFHGYQPEFLKPLKNEGKVAFGAKRVAREEKESWDMDPDIELGDVEESDM